MGSGNKAVLGNVTPYTDTYRSLAKLGNLSPFTDTYRSLAKLGKLSLFTDTYRSLAKLLHTNSFYIYVKCKWETYHLLRIPIVV